MTNLDLLFAFGNLRRKLNTLATQQANMIGLGPKQLMLVILLDKKIEVSMSKLSYETHSDMGAVSRSVSTLEKKGWVIRKKCIDDSRKQIVRLTHKGKAKADELGHIPKGLSYMFTKALTLHEKKEFKKLLDKISASLPEQWERS